MPSIENLLRDELMRVTDTVQPGQLRPLRIPAPGLRWRHRLRPVAAAAAVIAVAVSAVLVAGPKLTPAPAAAPVTAAVPRHYLTFTFVPDKQFHDLPVTEAVIRDTATGKITGTVKITTKSFPASVAATAARNCPIRESLEYLRTLSVLASGLNSSSRSGWTLSTLSS